MHGNVAGSASMVTTPSSTASSRLASSIPSTGPPRCIPRRSRRLVDHDPEDLRSAARMSSRAGWKVQDPQIEEHLVPHRRQVPRLPRGPRPHPTPERPHAGGRRTSRRSHHRAAPAQRRSLRPFHTSDRNPMSKTPSRRHVLASSAAAAAVGLARPTLALPPGRARRREELRVALVGCGGRGQRWCRPSPPRGT